MTTEACRTEIAIVGATPGGIAAALAAARQGRRVILLERHAHVGGMSASGLGKSDIERRDLIGGIFAEFIERVRQHYAETYGTDSRDYGLCQDGYYYEPSVAENVFRALLDEHPHIEVRTGCRFVRATRRGDRVVSITLEQGGHAFHVEAQVFIDATYEGDILAAAGAGYRLGREARSEFEEPHAGVIFYDYENGRILPGSTGEGDDRQPAYTYRLCLSRNPRTQVRIEQPPAGYDRRDYMGYLEDLAAGRLGPPKVFKPGWGYYPEHFNTLVRALSVTDMPNGKVDANINPRPLAFPFPEENTGYIEGNWAQRERIEARHRALAYGLLWFLQHDSAVSLEHRRMAQSYQLPADEFTDTGHQAWQLYVREGRRLRGRYTMTEHDVAQTPQSPAERHFADTIAVGEFPIDSFPVQKKASTCGTVLEGYLGMLAHITQPYPIPYRIMVPERVEGLLVPVAVSASHVAFSSIRMEPTWMALGQAAGAAAALAIVRGEQLADEIGRAHV